VLVLLNATAVSHVIYTDWKLLLHVATNNITTSVQNDLRWLMYNKKSEIV